MPHRPPPANHALAPPGLEEMKVISGVSPDCGYALVGDFAWHVRRETLVFPSRENGGR